MLGRVVVRSEKLIEFGNISFSAKSILVERLILNRRVKHLVSGNQIFWLNLIKTQNILFILNSQTMYVKTHSQKGNSPDI